LGGRATQCTKNTLKVFNGFRKTCCFVGDYCGHHDELVFLSSRPRMDLELISEELRSGDEFRATYEAHYDLRMKLLWMFQSLNLWMFQSLNL
ncbi:hypothetical protein X801_06944, partial [Opisthorchis viverrini]